jgi:dTDP-4-amino-4,6-dideoxygalactose transaminase
LAGEVLSLPIFPAMSSQQIERIRDAVRESHATVTPATR